MEGHKDLLSASKYGFKPEERPLKNYINQGIVIIDKPRGPSSHQVSAWVRNIVGVEKAGHAGTLDPNVSGVMVIAFEDAVRALDVTLLETKEYVGVLKLNAPVPEKEIREIFKEFIGEIYQFPPLRSAVKREMRTRRIFELEMLEYGDRIVLFRCVCESGTYIRTLCRDMGDALAVGGHMLELRRTRSGHFKESQCHTMHELNDAFAWFKENGDEKLLRDIILPFERLLDNLPKVYIKDSAVDAVCHGADLATPGIARIEGKYRKGQEVAIMSTKGEGVAIGIACMDSMVALSSEKGAAVELKRVFMRPDTYPKLWKRAK